jgi:hypothetical protein
VLTRLQGGLAAIVVTSLALGLIVLDLTDRGFREWWAGRALTSDLVAGLLVLSITLLVVDQVVGRRQIADRSRAVAAQVAILMNQATQTADAVSAALGGADGRDGASDEVRTYTLMLLVVAPLLIEEPQSRGFLEQAQRVAGELERVLRAMARTGDPSSISHVRLDDAVTRLRELSKPLLQVLDLEAFFAADAETPS